MRRPQPATVFTRPAPGGICVGFQVHFARPAAAVDRLAAVAAPEPLWNRVSAGLTVRVNGESRPPTLEGLEPNLDDEHIDGSRLRRLLLGTIYEVTARMPSDWAFGDHVAVSFQIEDDS